MLPQEVSFTCINVFRAVIATLVDSCSSNFYFAEFSSFVMELVMGISGKQISRFRAYAGLLKNILVNAFQLVSASVFHA